MKTGYIYKVTNKVTGESYIGQTCNSVAFRWEQHKRANDNYDFHKAIKKYGPANFDVTTLEQCNIEDLNSREIYYIAKYNTFRKGYNMTRGGAGSWEHQNHNKVVFTDTQFDDIKDMFEQGYSITKISRKFNVDRHIMSDIIKGMGYKIKVNKIEFNDEEFKELVENYQTGCSLKTLAKRYNCSATGLSDYMKSRGVDLRKKYSIMEDDMAQQLLICEYLNGTMPLAELRDKYHCDYRVFRKILKRWDIKQKGAYYKLTPLQCLEIIKLYNSGKPVSEIKDLYGVDKCTIYNMFKRYNIKIEKL